MTITIATSSNAIDKMYLRLAKIQTFVGGQQLTNATGFFYLHDEFLYLVTSRHVVINETATHRPDRLQVSLHSDAANLQQRAELSIPLYLGGVPQWYQHPKYGVDVVAVAINDPCVLSSHFVHSFCCEDILNKDYALPLGRDVLILGFPLGFHDTLHNLPIVRRATIASSFSHPFKGEPYFLTDARLHRGMSGSPVIATLPDWPNVASKREPSWRLLGIHSSALDVSDRDPNQDERLALNTAWYASLLPEMIPSCLVSSADAAGTKGSLE
jgi:Trypsin-like peptidase domain